MHEPVQAASSTSTQTKTEATPAAGEFTLAVATPQSWATAFTAVTPSDRNVGALLLEQAHLEKKAAAGAMGFLFRYPDRPEIQKPLSMLAREELVHFERVLKLMGSRGLDFAPQQPSRYAAGLKRAILDGPAAPGGEPVTPEIRAIDEFCVAGLIELRSCERMQLLAKAYATIDAEAADLWDVLVEAEARHHDDYVSLALHRAPRDLVRARWGAAAAAEARVVRHLSPGVRLHSGWVEPGH